MCTSTHTHTHTYIVSHGNGTEEKVFEKRKVFQWVQTEIGSLFQYGLIKKIKLETNESC